ncbi:MAG: recombinase family protein [Paraburkholderia sp.]|uniref:recombinase family protein n=1 Tax=Paraburkholderia sp. TaxID=1926495 RepID=UPI003C61A912
MAAGKFVVYFRVSTQKQGASGLGLEAQSEAITRFLNGGNWEVVDSFTEIETGKGANALDKRPQLRAAIDLCHKTGARLLIAKLDRLARNVHFISGLKESKVEFVAVDMPEANELMVNILAAFAQHEAKMIGERTKAALAAAKARGTQLGSAGTRNLQSVIQAQKEAADSFASGIANVLAELEAAGFSSQRKIVEELNRRGIKTARGSEWSLIQLQRVLARLPQKATA